jgi:uncharacterized ferritin-like protein (DUF455 family)
MGKDVRPQAHGSFFETLESLVLSEGMIEKCRGIRELNTRWSNFDDLDHNSPVNFIKVAGLPTRLQLVPPGKLKRRGIKSQEARNILMHSIAHIEFSAINLAMDACYRFRNLPKQYYQDWLNVAADEARHFELINAYLNLHNCNYGDYPVHNGLWDMAAETAHDPIARMALVPRVLEARGLDVTPPMIARFDSVGDNSAVEILNVIYQDEIGHVYIGSKWFRHLCDQANVEPRQMFMKMVSQYFHGELRGPFNVAARLQAGFDREELEELG